MTTFCYVRVANKECLSEESPKESISQNSQAELAKAYAEKQGFKVVNTGNSRVDAKILSLLTRKGAQLNEAVITFRG